MHKPISPITQMLIRQMQEVKVLLRDVKEKMETVDVDEMLEKKSKKILDKPE